ncbi:hypothetical protein [Prosthecobacter debontii]|nr:hypothetical protein [Prosthecobacter debontii]
MSTTILMDILRIGLGLVGLWMVWQVFKVFKNLSKNSESDLSASGSSNDETHP